MKPFDLQKALAGDLVVTRDGRPVTQIHVFKVDGEPVYGVVDGGVTCWPENGHYNPFTDEEDPFDLFMAS